MRRAGALPPCPAHGREVILLVDYSACRICSASTQRPASAQALMAECAPMASAPTVKP